MFAEPDGARTLVGRWVHDPNLPGRSLFDAVEQPLSARCDGCGGPMGQGFDQRQALAVSDGGGAQRRRFWRGDAAAPHTTLEYFYEADRVVERRLNEAGALVRTDHHLVDGAPPRIVQTREQVDGADCAATRDYAYGLQDELRAAVLRAGDAVTETRRYGYDLDGRWSRLDVHGGDAMAPRVTQYLYDQSCLACLDRDRCEYDVPAECTHVPLRQGPDGFAGGWPTVACDQPASQQSAAEFCAEAWGGALARFESAADQRWAAQVAGIERTPWRVAGEVDPDGIPRWTETGARVPAEQMGAAVAPGQCLVLASNGLLFGARCSGGLASDFKPFFCERRPE